MDQPFTRLHPLDGSDNGTGIFPCGRNLNAIEAKPFQLPTTLICNNCTLQFSLNDSDSTYYSCSDIIPQLLVNMRNCDPSNLNKSCTCVAKKGYPWSLFVFQILPFAVLIGLGYWTYQGSSQIISKSSLKEKEDKKSRNWIKKRKKEAERIRRALAQNDLIGSDLMNNGLINDKGRIRGYSNELLTRSSNEADANFERSINPTIGQKRYGQNMEDDLHITDDLEIIPEERTDAKRRSKRKPRDSSPQHLREGLYMKRKMSGDKDDRLRKNNQYKRSYMYEDDLVWEDYEREPEYGYDGRYDEKYADNAGRQQRTRPIRYMNKDQNRHVRDYRGDEDSERSLESGSEDRVLGRKERNRLRRQIVMQSEGERENKRKLGNRRRVNSEGNLGINSERKYRKLLKLPPKNNKLRNVNYLEKSNKPNLRRMHDWRNFDNDDSELDSEGSEGGRNRGKYRRYENDEGMRYKDRRSKRSGEYDNLGRPRKDYPRGRLDRDNFERNEDDFMRRPKDKNRNDYEDYKRGYKGKYRDDNEYYQRISPGKDIDEDYRRRSKGRSGDDEDYREYKGQGRNEDYKRDSKGEKYKRRSRGKNRSLEEDNDEKSPRGNKDHHGDSRRISREDSENLKGKSTKNRSTEKHRDERKSGEKKLIKDKSISEKDQVGVDNTIKGKDKETKGDVDKDSIPEMNENITDKGDSKVKRNFKLTRGFPLGKEGMNLLKVDYEINSEGEWQSKGYDEMKPQRIRRVNSGIYSASRPEDEYVIGLDGKYKVKSPKLVKEKIDLNARKEMMRNLLLTNKSKKLDEELNVGTKFVRGNVRPKGEFKMSKEAKTKLKEQKNAKEFAESKDTNIIRTNEELKTKQITPPSDQRPIKAKLQDALELIKKSAIEPKEKGSLGLGGRGSLGLKGKSGIGTKGTPYPKAKTISKPNEQNPIKIQGDTYKARGRNKYKLSHKPSLSKILEIGKKHKPILEQLDDNYREGEVESEGEWRLQDNYEIVSKHTRAYSMGYFNTQLLDYHKEFDSEEIDEVKSEEEYELNEIIEIMSGNRVRRVKSDRIPKIIRRNYFGEVTEKEAKTPLIGKSKHITNLARRKKVEGKKPLGSRMEELGLELKTNVNPTEVKAGIDKNQLKGSPKLIAEKSDKFTANEKVKDEIKSPGGKAVRASEIGTMEFESAESGYIPGIDEYKVNNEGFKEFVTKPEDIEGNVKASGAMAEDISKQLNAEEIKGDNVEKKVEGTSTVILGKPPISQLKRVARGADSEVEENPEKFNESSDTGEGKKSKIGSKSRKKRGLISEIFAKNMKDKKGKKIAGVSDAQRTSSLQPGSDLRKGSEDVLGGTLSQGDSSMSIDEPIGEDANVGDIAGMDSAGQEGVSSSKEDEKVSKSFSSALGDFRAQMKLSRKPLRSKKKAVALPEVSTPSYKNLISSAMEEAAMTFIKKVIASDQDKQLKEHKIVGKDGKAIWKKTHFIFMIDCSGSMKGSRWEAVKLGFTICLHKLKDMKEVLISAFVFDDKPTLFCREKTPSEMIPKIKSLPFTGNGTNYKRAMDFTISLIGKAHKFSYLSCVMFLSDGLGGFPEDSVNELLVLKGKGRKVVFYTIACETDEDNDMISLANGLRGEHYKLTSLEASKVIFSTILQI